MKNFGMRGKQFYGVFIQYKKKSGKNKGFNDGKLITTPKLIISVYVYYKPTFTYWYPLLRSVPLACLLAMRWMFGTSSTRRTKTGAWRRRRSSGWGMPGPPSPASTWSPPR